MIFITIYILLVKIKIISILHLTGEARKFLSFRTQAQKIKVEINTQDNSIKYRCSQNCFSNEKISNIASKDYCIDICTYPKNKYYYPDESDKTKMIFLCSPNNPTGTLIDREVLIDIASKNPDILIIIDEAYFEYSEVTNKDLIDEFNNIFIIRTMSKVLGLAGMRVGYGLSCEEIIEYMHRIKPVFSLTRLSFVAALNTFKDTQYIEDSIKKGIESRQYLYDEISKIENLKIFPSKSNFMLIGVKDTGFTASQLALELMKKGVIVRDCTSFKGLDEYWIRISICTLEEDKKFIKILKEVLS